MFKIKKKVGVFYISQNSWTDLGQLSDLEKFRIKILIMSVLCTICARGGSKGLKNKALKKIMNKPLINYTIQQAINSKVFKEVVVSTDSKKIQKTSIKAGAKTWFLRPKKLSNDYCSKLLAIRHAFIESEKYFGKKFKYCIDLDITSLLRTSQDIKTLNFSKNKNLQT